MIESKTNLSPAEPGVPLAQAAAAKAAGSNAAEISDFIREIIAEDLAQGRHEAPVTRFPPEPNGSLHIGHAKAICLNFGIAQEYAERGARCYLRFDDTNPTKEEQRYIDAMKEDIAWLGFAWQEPERFASGYFENMLRCALHLIEKSLAYVDEQSTEELRATRGNDHEPGKNSPYRERSVEENLAQFQAMRQGAFADGKAVLRAKIDMQSENLNMRDPVLYRVLHAAHHQCGEHWKIYPMYDFAHPLGDAFEGVTHSLCSLEFEDHRPLYNWVIEHCQEVIADCVGQESRPRQIEFSRLNLGYTLTSKRKLAALVDKELVTGWDDPRLPTIAGMRRRGIAPEAIVEFCRKIGVTKQVGVTDIKLFEHTIREVHNRICPRYMAVLDPLKVRITNWSEEAPRSLRAILNPEDPEAGSREIPFGPELFIERGDFLLEAPRKFFRLKPGGEVRLRYAYVLRCDEVLFDESGLPQELLCSVDWDTLGKNPQGRKVKGVVHWVNAQEARPAELRHYERLFAVERPDQFEGELADCLEKDSYQKAQCWMEPALAEALSAESRVQLERVGYYVADRYDHRPEQPVLNRTISLRDGFKG